MAVPCSLWTDTLISVSKVTNRAREVSRPGVPFLKERVCTVQIVKQRIGDRFLTKTNSNVKTARQGPWILRLVGDTMVKSTQLSDFVSYNSACIGKKKCSAA